MELGGNLELLERLRVEKDVFYVDRIVFGLKKEGGRGGCNGIDAAGELRQSREDRRGRRDRSQR